MGYNKNSDSSLVQPMAALAAKAMSLSKGLRVETNSNSEANRLRAQIYAARRLVRAKNSNDESPISLVELRLENNILWIFRPGGMLNRFNIVDAETGEQVTPEPTKADRMLGKLLTEPTDEELLSMMIKIAEKKGPGNHEQEARELLAKGETL